MLQRLFSLMILNAQDSNGNTALHGAVRSGNLAVFSCLFRNPQVRLDVANKDGMTPLDLSYTMLPAGSYYGLNPASIVRSSLLAVGAPHRVRTEGHIPKRDLDKKSKKHIEAMQGMSIVIALVAIIALFASAFTLRMRGGSRAADVLAGSYAFDVFVIASTLAFLYSIAATCTFVFAGLPTMDISIRNWYLNVSAILLQSATRSLVVAFGLEAYLVWALVNRTAAVAVCVIVFTTPLYAYMEDWWIACMAAAVLARHGIRRPSAALLTWAPSVFFHVLVPFGSYVIIFGLPAIGKWVIPGVLKWHIP